MKYGPFKCELCGQEFRPKNPKSFSSSMRQHRKNKHPFVKGPIKYKNVPYDRGE